MLKLTGFRKFCSLLMLTLASWSATTNASAADALTPKDRALIPVAAFTASGDIEQLKVSLNEALNTGLTVNELKEVLVQLYAYAGFPRSLNGLAAFMTVLDERQSQGITDVQGKASSPLPTDVTSLAFGAANQTRLVGAEVKGPLFDFAPQVDDYLKAHLFGDIFERDGLSWKQRELATIAALANMSGVNSQLAAHYAISMNNGVSPAELTDFIAVLDVLCGAEIAANAQQVLEHVLKNTP
ncbi:carboxymuconolactone decarboxylase family protein [Vibrio furnissii]|uniref:carboxymuconolactone decarboxylase family protein n=1 Tax=Vibrio furnissii TaxID=29494 RepID=UPI001E4A4C76|nr:carboxymuconolactone decarboxylase family protein [Vibrio furnissii]UHJ63383.1 carboxymuconolactone decarboxylase family protein [Vibrio furnissii]